MTGKEGSVGSIAVIGISPRRRFDERYQTICKQVASNVAAAVNNALAYEEARTGLVATTMTPAFTSR